jgi:hypothetical protein
MRNLTSLVAVLLIGYFFLSPAPCGIPLTYRIGSIDDSFGLTESQARVALSDAEAMWEDAVGQDIFVSDPESSFTVNFVYDERQQLTDEEKTLRHQLDTQKNLNESIREEYELYAAAYEELKLEYEKRERAYAKELEAYNKSVADWNKKGGAPEEVYAQLNREQERLAAEGEELNDMVEELNGLVDSLNALGQQGDSLVTTYNEIVGDYNDRFNSEREFTQGDYQGDAIHIYEYADGAELRIVLAHELGHALSIDHVEGPQSIMYYFMGAQSLSTGLTTEDIEAFEEKCSPKWYHRQRYY